MLEFLAPVARAAALREPFSPALQANRARQYAIARAELSALFAAELAAAGPGASAELLNALTVATTWPAWSVLRDDLGLAVPAARQVMARTVRALVGCTDSAHS